jgi:hypothetical protein
MLCCLHGLSELALPADAENAERAGLCAGTRLAKNWPIRALLSMSPVEVTFQPMLRIQSGLVFVQVLDLQKISPFMLCCLCCFCFCSLEPSMKMGIDVLFLVLVGLRVPLVLVPVQD